MELQSLPGPWTWESLGKDPPCGTSHTLAFYRRHLHIPPYAKQARGSFEQHEYLGHTLEVPFIMDYLSQ